MTGEHTEDSLIVILEQALDAISAGRYDHIYDSRRGENIPWHLDRDIERLDACFRDPEGSRIINEDDYWNVIQDCLETALQNPLATYKRPQEPICTHKEAEGSEMYAFVVQLPNFTRKIYTKFCLEEQPDGTWYISIRCHT